MSAWAFLTGFRHRADKTLISEAAFFMNKVALVSIYTLFLTNEHS